MNVLLSSLRELPEYEKLLRSVEQGEIAALSGVGQINRSHVIAAGLDVVDHLKALDNIGGVVASDEVGLIDVVRTLDGLGNGVIAA